MNSYIIVWYDNTDKDFNNDCYERVTKSEAVKKFYNTHDNDAIIINIIKL